MKLKPRAVRPPGQAAIAPHIRIVAPASNAQPARLAEGAAKLSALGYTVSFGEHAEGRHAPYFSSSAEARLADLHEAFADPSVEIVMCTRGGYGSNYLLAGLDCELIRANPKPFFAYSDLTAVQTRLMDQTGLVAFHGPMLAADFYREDGVDLASFTAALAGELLRFDASHGLRTLRPGRAQGTLYGGCLTLLTASLGTPYAPRTEGKVFFIEDVGVKPYQVDRMLRQLWLAGKFDGVQAIIFGEMPECASPGAHPALLEEAILYALRDFSGPIAMGLRSGHVSRANLTLPLNIEVDLDLFAEPILRTLEPAVRVETEG